MHELVQFLYLCLKIYLIYVGTGLLLAAGVGFFIYCKFFKERF